MLRPTDRASENIYFVAGGGPNCDYARAATDNDYLREYLKGVIKDPKITIGKVETIAEWTYVSVF